MNPTDRAALIADVAAICLESMQHDAEQPCRRWVGRAAQIREIAQDNRVTSRSNYTRRALIDDVMTKYGVTYSNAKKLIGMARNERNETDPQAPPVTPMADAL